MLLSYPDTSVFLVGASRSTLQASSVDDKERGGLGFSPPLVKSVNRSQLPDVPVGVLRGPLKVSPTLASEKSQGRKLRCAMQAKVRSC